MNIFFGTVTLRYSGVPLYQSSWGLRDNVVQRQWKPKPSRWRVQWKDEQKYVCHAVFVGPLKENRGCAPATYLSRQFGETHNHLNFYRRHDTLPFLSPVRNVALNRSFLAKHASPLQILIWGEGESIFFMLKYVAMISWHQLTFNTFIHIALVNNTIAVFSLAPSRFVLTRLVLKPVSMPSPFASRNCHVSRSDRYSHLRYLQKMRDNQAKCMRW